MQVIEDKLRLARKAIEIYQEAHAEMHFVSQSRGVATDHDSIMETLVGSLRKSGFSSLGDYETKLREFMSSDEAHILRVEKLPATIAVLDASSEAKPFDILPGVDICLALSKPFNILRIMDESRVTEQVDLEACQVLSILVRTPQERSQLKVMISLRQPRGKPPIFSGKRTAELWIRQEPSQPEWGITRLLGLVIKDVCEGLGLTSCSAPLEKNDVYLNNKKVSGNRTAADVAGVSYAHCFCNLELDFSLMERATFGKLNSSYITSIEKELGRTVSSEAYKRLFIESLSKRFDLRIEEWQPKL